MGRFTTLSRNRENILRLISRGMTSVKHFSAADVDALSSLALIELHQGTLGLTEQGKLKLVQEQKRFFQSIIFAARD